MVRRTVRRFVDEKVMPVIGDHFRDARFPAQLVGEMAELGSLGANLEGYGCAGMSDIDYGLVMQEIERGDSSLRGFSSVQGRRRDFQRLFIGSTLLTALLGGIGISQQLTDEFDLTTLDLPIASPPQNSARWVFT